MGIRIEKTTITSLGMLLLLLAMYSIGTISAIIVSWAFTLLLMGAATVMFAVNYALNSHMPVSKTVICAAVLTLLCGLGIFYGRYETIFLFYVMLSVMLLTAGAMDRDSLYGSLKLIRVFGLFFSFGCYWQLLFPSQYYAWLYPLFGEEYKQSIQRQFALHKMCTGFTSQTAVAATFIILGLMAVIYMYTREDSPKRKLVSLIELVFIFGGLLLTGKRSPLINLAAALLVVDMLTVRRNKRTTRIMVIILGMMALLVGAYFAAPLFSGSRNSIVRLFESLTSGGAGDITNGRIELYQDALREFAGSPLVGIGWGKYASLYDVAGVHNIYLQLLCECGIIGFILAFGAMAAVLLRSIRMVRMSKDTLDPKTYTLLKCSIFIQVYILVYGIFGNPLYDQQYLIMYMLGILYSSVTDFVTVSDRKMAVNRT